MPFWRWLSPICRLQKGPGRPMTTNELDTQERVASNANQSHCLVCGEEGIERYKLTLRQPLRGNGHGRIVENGSICEQCTVTVRNNAISAEGTQ